MKTEKRPVEITVAGELPGFEYGGCRSIFLNLGLDVEMGEVIDTAELERNRRRTA